MVTVTYFLRRMVVVSQRQRNDNKHPVLHAHLINCVTPYYTEYSGWKTARSHTG